jgi:hypothetical protein
VCHTGQTGICVQKAVPATQNSSIISFDLLFVPEDLCMCCILFSLGKTAIMSGSPHTQYYERRKKIRRNVNAGEGSSRNPPPQRQSKRTVHRDFPRGHMHIDTEIEEVEEDRMETSEDESADHETYKMSPMPASETSAEEDDQGDGSEEGQEDEVENEEEGGMIEGTLNARSGQRDPFDPSPTIRMPHKSLRYVVANYKGKGATNKLKKLRKVDPRSQQKDASDYRFHNHFQQDIYETVIMDRKKIVSEPSSMPPYTYRREVEQEECIG